MRTLVISSLLFLAVSGTAIAGHGGGGGGRGGGGSRGGGRATVVVHGGGGGRVGGGVVVRGGGGVVVRGPTVVVGGRARYYDQRMRPSIIVERYGRRPGYYWIPGAWQWDGREWIWGGGRYEVDPNYGPPPGPVYDGGY